jgi:hypothetical protein
MLNRACTEKEQVIQKQICQIAQGNVGMVRDILLENQFPSLSNEEGYSICIGVWYFSCGSGFEGFAKETRKLSCIKDAIKEMSGRPKTTVCINNITTGGLREVIPSAYRGPRVTNFINTIPIFIKENRFNNMRRK